MNSTVNKASRQLFTRPNDELYQDWSHLIGTLRARERRVAEVQVKRIGAFASEDKVKLQIVNGNSTYERNLNDWSFNNLCRVACAPSGYINSLSPELAAKCIDYGINQNGFVSGA